MIRAKNPSEMTLSEADMKEEENYGLLHSMMGDAFDPQVVRRVLRKYNGDLQKAAEAILEGDTGETHADAQSLAQLSDFAMMLGDPVNTGPPKGDIQRSIIRVSSESSGSGSGSGLNAPRSSPSPSSTSSSASGASTVTPTSGAQMVQRAPPNSVIDLTAEDDDDSEEMQKAMRMSLSQEPYFGPSDRAPNPDWQMVPSNVAQISQEDTSLKQAIEASLVDYPMEASLPLTQKEMLRQDNRPISLRPVSQGHIYACLIIQALYHVPQVREAIASLPVPSIDPEGKNPDEAPQRSFYFFQELFTNFDLATLSTVLDPELISHIDAPDSTQSNKKLGDLATELTTKIGYTIELSQRYKERSEGHEVISSNKERLFHFTHGRVHIRPNLPNQTRNNEGDGCVVAVDGGANRRNPNELIARLSTDLTVELPTGGSDHDVIVTPSQVVAFNLRPSPSPTAISAPGVKPPPIVPFKYSKEIYLDQFHLDNLELANQKRAIEADMFREMDELVTTKQLLTTYDNRDNLADLRATLHYYEKIALDHGDEERKAGVQQTAKDLKRILDALVAKIEEIDKRLDVLKEDSANIFNCPELRHHRYDLRAVIVNSGVPGRRQLYSYVQDERGRWWKTLDYVVTEVTEETVMTDSTGLLLGAGPFFLVYSKHLEPEEIKKPLTWPSVFVDAVHKNNEEFVFKVAPEVARASSPGSLRDKDKENEKQKGKEISEETVTDKGRS